MTAGKNAQYPSRTQVLRLSMKTGDNAVHQSPLHQWQLQHFRLQQCYFTITPA
jgi:hypothetical protein